MCTIVSKRKAPSGLEGLLEIVGDGERCQGWYTFEWLKGEFQIVVAVTLKLWVPKEVRTYGMKSKLVFDDLREQVESQACKDESR